jgi:endoglucanase
MAATALALAACTSAQPALQHSLPATSGPLPGTGSQPLDRWAWYDDVLSGTQLYVDPDSRAAQVLRSKTVLSGSQRSSLVHLSRQPVATWIGDDVAVSVVARQVRALVSAAAARREIPVLVLYAIPHRDCGGRSGGGEPSARAYRAWVDRVAAGLGSRRAVVVLEPDSLAQEGCLAPALRRQRVALLRYAVSTLARDRASLVYLDGGNSRWQPAAVMAARIAQVGVTRVRGFSVDVAGFGALDREVAYGREISARLGRVPFLVDTSRNGRGPATGITSWCNPRGRGLGREPTTSPGTPPVDALLWVKTPGVSDGACRPGEPRAGTYWPAYGDGLVRRRATD